MFREISKMVLLFSTTKVSSGRGVVFQQHFCNSTLSSHNFTSASSNSNPRVSFPRLEEALEARKCCTSREGRRRPGGKQAERASDRRRWRRPRPTRASRSRRAARAAGCWRGGATGRRRCCRSARPRRRTRTPRGATSRPTSRARAPTPRRWPRPPSRARLCY